MRLADRGVRHPDDDVADAAVRAARATLVVRSFLDTTAFHLALSLALLAVAVMWDETFPRWVAGLGGSACLVLTIFHWGLKRQARRIMALPRAGS